MELRAQFARELHVGEDFVISLVHQLGDLVETISELVGDSAPLLVSFLGGFLRERSADHGRDHLLLVRWSRMAGQLRGFANTTGYGD